MNVSNGCSTPILQSGHSVSHTHENEDTEQTSQNGYQRQNSGSESHEHQLCTMLETPESGPETALTVSPEFPYILTVREQSLVSTQVAVMSLDGAMRSHTDAARSDEAPAHRTLFHAATPLSSTHGTTLDNTVYRYLQFLPGNEGTIAADLSATNRRFLQGNEQWNQLRMSHRAEFPKKEGILVDYADMDGVEAYKIRDNIKSAKGEYIFLWEIGKVGRVVTTLEREDFAHIPVKVLQVQMAVAQEPCCNMPFKQSSDDQMQTVITVPLAASFFRSPKLKVPSPCFGLVDAKYVRLNILITLALEGSPSDKQTFRGTVLCRLHNKKKMPFRYLARECTRWWESMPADARNLIECIPLHVKQGLQFVGMVVASPIVALGCMGSG